MRRRAFLSLGAASLTSVAGCLAVGSSSPDTEPSIPWRRDGEVYHPGHEVGMQMIGMAQEGDLTVALSYSYPDRFWTISGGRRNRVGLEDKSSSIHLMASLWNSETETVFPVASGLRVRVEHPNDDVTQRAMWPMLTQNMGFHFGDNILIPEWGQHSITVDIGSPALQPAGRLRGSFEGTDSVRFDVDLQLSKRNRIGVDRQSQQRGTHAAAPPMEMSRHPLSFAPWPEDMPGRLLGRDTSGDGVFLVFLDESSLVVSPRTPFNRFILPLMSLSARVERDGETVSEGQLAPAIDATRQYHYRGPAEDIHSGDTITLSVDAPPQTARHIGYETAFLEMPDVTVTV